MRIDPSCAACGKNCFSLTEAGNDNSVVTCEDCGHVIGTMGDLKEKVAAAVLTRASSVSG